MSYEAIRFCSNCNLKPEELENLQPPKSLKTCPICKIAQYCDKNCQKQDYLSFKHGPRDIFKSQLFTQNQYRICWYTLYLENYITFCCFSTHFIWQMLKCLVSIITVQRDYQTHFFGLSLSTPPLIVQLRIYVLEKVSSIHFFSVLAKTVW